jgi:curved DNA-binding protein CbpA
VAKKTLYQVLQVQANAPQEAIKEAYDARLAALGDGATPEAAAERVILREAYELLSDAARRRFYDDKLREERFRALSSGGEEESRPRPANVRLDTIESAGGPGAGWMVGAGLLLAVSVAGGWVWLDHKRKVEAQRLEEKRVAEESARRAEQDRLAREREERERQRQEKNEELRQTAMQRRDEYQRSADNRRIEYERQQLLRQEEAEARRRQNELQRADYEQRRRDQEEQRRSQMQLERERRYLQELERNRGMSIPQR